jgi:hypothetical protein
MGHIYYGESAAGRASVLGGGLGICSFKIPVWHHFRRTRFELIGPKTCI